MSLPDLCRGKLQRPSEEIEQATPLPCYNVTGVNCTADNTTSLSDNHTISVETASHQSEVPEAQMEEYYTIKRLVHLKNVIKKPSVVAHSYNPITQEVETGGLL